MLHSRLSEMQAMQESGLLTNSWVTKQSDEKTQQDKFLFENESTTETDTP